MSYFRQIHTLIWKDEDFLEFSQAEKLLFIYFFSNESTTLSGLYKIPLRVVSFETGISLSVINKALEKFERLKKIYYRDGFVFVTKFQKYNRGGDKVDISIRHEIENIPDCEIKRIYIAYYQPNIPYTYPIISKEEKRKEENSKEEPEKSTATTPYVRIFANVTGMTSIPGEADTVLTAIDGLMDKHKTEDAITEYLKPFYQKWIKTKGKNGKYYSKLNNAWLTDYAVAGEMPGSGLSADAGINPYEGAKKYE